MRMNRTESGIAALVAVLVVVGVGAALANRSNDSHSSIAIKSRPVLGDIRTPMRVDRLEGSPPSNASWWSPIAAVKLTSLSEGTQIVNCWEGIKQLPRGVRLEVGKGFFEEHPGFHFLTDGRCALDPSATTKPLAANRGTYGIPTKAFDLQWFGTGVDGGPPVGGSSCFVGDPLNNHCGIETNIRSVPALLARGEMLPPKWSAP